MAVLAPPVAELTREGVWREYLHATREALRRGTYDEVEPWAWAYLRAQLKRIRARERREAARS